MVLSEDRPLVRLELASSPETLTLVRAMLGGVAEELSMDPELLDDLKTAVSEAANNVVMHAYGSESGPLWVSLHVTSDVIEVVVRDQGQGIPSVTPADDRLQGVGIPIMRALAQQTAFRALPEGGTEVWMEFAGMREGQPLYQAPEVVAPEDERSGQLTGDAVVSLSPVSLLGAVLGRLARALAARARFSLDRFSDVYLVTDALADYAGQAASDSRIYFCIATSNRRMEVTVGPFRAGASSELSGDETGDVASALRVLSDEFEMRPENGTEALHLVMLDQRLRSSTPA
ncbi:MAG TPA: ATP-binding protein [Solirubrobacteraceae bacterium]|nr:ATP-binding protein [Solirubrobacteraceae bacterium]